MALKAVGFLEHTHFPKFKEISTVHLARPLTTAIKFLVEAARANGEAFNHYHTSLKPEERALYYQQLIGSSIHPNINRL